MIVECLIKREGPTSVRVGGFDFTFEPNEKGRSVCEVNDKSVLNHLLSLNYYKPYEEKKQEAKPEEVKPKAEVMKKEPLAIPEGLIVKNDGRPYKSEQGAKAAIRQRHMNPKTTEIVKLENGKFALRVEAADEHQPDSGSD